MIGRRVLLLVALAAGIASGILYFASARRVPVVVAARDLLGIEALTADDLTLRAFPADGVPVGSFDDPQVLVGQHLRAPLEEGQLVLEGVVFDRARLFSSGLSAPAGTRALAIPVGPGQALGGALAAGARVDVVAVPVPGRAPAGRPTELLSTAALVLDVRSESGTALTDQQRTKAIGAVAERIGSVILALPIQQAMWIADRSPVSTFVLVSAETP